MSVWWISFIAVLIGANIIGLVWLLMWTSKRRPGDPQPEDTSHYWDEDITEYNKPMPRWWINSFYLTILFGIGYFAWYGGLGSLAGFGEWSSRAEHARERDYWDKQLAQSLQAFADKPIDQLAQDPKALEIGRSIFGNTCAGCHGSSGQGAIGYPNLADNVWHWGGAPEAITTSVLAGRQGMMPALGGAVGGAQGVRELTVYVQSLSGEVADPELAAAGAARFAGICAACHGPAGKGNPAMGAPDLTDRYTLYGRDAQSIRDTINKGRNGQMPAHAPILGETRARLAAAYVWSLSNRPATVAPP